GEERWGRREWNFFLEDLRDRHLAPGGKMYFALNPGASGAYYAPDLRDFFLGRGAKVERERIFFANGLRSCESALGNPHSAIQFTHFPPSEVRMGNSSSMNCVLPIAPHIRVPVASYQYLLICSPVWQPQLLMNAPLAKARRSICFKSSSCIHAFEELSTTLL